MLYTQSSGKYRMSLFLALVAFLSNFMAFSAIALASQKASVQDAQRLLRKETSTLTKSFPEIQIEPHPQNYSTIPSHNQTKDSLQNLAKVLPDNNDS